MPRMLAEEVLQREHHDPTPERAQRLPGTIRQAAAEAVRRHAEVGIDVGNDGEMIKIVYATYVKERLSA
ncbi:MULTISPECIES: hypothetical protein [Frankia]|nr:MULTISPECIES: hypothetical protein [Frankia]